MNDIWDEAKHAWLLEHRHISFEQIVRRLTQGYLLDTLICDKAPYQGQEQLVVNVDDYAYVVPIERRGDTIILKTIIPSRKLTRKYLRRKTDAENGATDS